MMDRRTFLGLAASTVADSSILPAVDAPPVTAAPPADLASVTFAGEVSIPAGGTIRLQIKPFDREDIAIVQASLHPGEFLVRANGDGSNTVLFRNSVKQFPPRPLLSLTKTNSSGPTQKA